MGWFLSAGFGDSHRVSRRGRGNYTGSAHRGVGVAAIDRGGSPEITGRYRASGLAGLEEPDYGEDAPVVVARLRNAQLHEDAVDVLLDRRVGHPQLLRD